MKQYHITMLHCRDCADELVERLETATGHKGFAYDAEEGVLTVQDGEDFDKIESVLNADKILILDDLEDAPSDSEELSVDSTHHEDSGHSHEHHHHNSNHHGNHAANGAAEKNILLVFLLNLIFSIIEFFAGIAMNSTSIFSDAIHDLGDALSVGLAWIFEKISQRHQDEHYTFGHRRFSLLGALITGIVLIVGSIIALSRAVPRLINPEPVDYSGMFWLSIMAIIVNGVAAYILHGRSSKNESMLNVHMLEDLLGWVGILIISAILHFKPWYILDPIVSVVIALYILKEAIEQTVGTVRILLESVPEGVQINDLEKKILQVKGVHGLTHLHFWSMDGEQNNFAVTLFTEENSVSEHTRIRKDVQNLVAPMGVNCSTIEINYDPDRLITIKQES